MNSGNYVISGNYNTIQYNCSICTDIGVLHWHLYYLFVVAEPRRINWPVQLNYSVSVVYRYIFKQRACHTLWRLLENAKDARHQLV